MASIFKEIIDQILIGEKYQAFIKKGLSGTVVLEFGAKILLFCSTLLLTNYLSKEDYGFYSYAMGWVISLATIATLGLDDYLIKAMGKEKKEVYAKLLSPALLLTSFIAFLSALAFYIVFKYKIGILYFALAIIFLTFQWMISALLKGRKHILSAQVSEQFVRSGVFLLILLIYLSLHQTFDFLIASKGLAIAALSSLVTSLVLWTRKENLSSLFQGGSVKSLINKEVLFFALLSFFGVFRHKLDVILLGGFDLFVETGIYNLASKLADLILVGLAISSAVFMPLFAEQKKIDMLRRILKSTAIINFIIGLVAFLVFTFFGKWILSIFGAGFDAGYDALLLLSGSTWMYAILGPYIILLMMQGFAKEVLVGLILGTLVQFVLGINLIPISPVNGMAISKGLSIIIIQIFMMVVAWKKLGLKPFFFN